MKKVLFSATVDSHILQFHIPFLKLFKERGYEVHVATNGNEDIPYCDVKHVVSFERSPFKLNNLKAIGQLKKIIEKEKFDIIHTHTPMGAVVTRLASIKARKKYHTRVIYTAHGLHFFKGAPLMNWLIFYPVEKFLSKYTDTLILINQEDYDLCKRKFKKCKNIEYVPGVGIDEEKFNFKMTKKEKRELRESLGLKEDDFVMIYPAELSKRKRQIWLINCINGLLKEHNDIHLLLPGKDSLNGQCQELVNQLNLNTQIHFLGYRNDIPKLLNISDLSLSTANQEGLPVNIMEAMYVGLPIVASNCRGNRDLVFNHVNGYLVDLEDNANFVNCVDKIYSSNNKNYKYAEESKYIIKSYLLEKILVKMINIYFFASVIDLDDEKNLVSIIVPIHNSGKYLEKCLNSIINQTYKNLEIILINDNSNDNSKTICENYRMKDSRIITKKVNFCNVSKVRNYGLELCKGDYVCFFDSDDYIENNMIEIMLSNMIYNKSQISCCGFYFEDEKGHIYKKNKGNTHSLIGKDFLYDMHANKNLLGYVWNKMYKRSILIDNKIRFDENINVMEDDLFNYEIVDYNMNVKVFIDEKKMYHYIKHCESISKQKFDNRKMTMYASRIKEIDILEKNNINSDYLKADYIIHFSRDKFIMKKRIDSSSELFKKCKLKYDEYKSLKLHKNVSFKTKFLLVIATRCPYIFLILNKMGV